MSWLVGCVLSSLLIVAVIGEAFADAEADPACNNCGQRPPYIKGARVSTNAGNFLLEFIWPNANEC